MTITDHHLNPSRWQQRILWLRQELGQPCEVVRRQRKLDPKCKSNT